MTREEAIELLDAFKVGLMDTYENVTVTEHVEASLRRCVNAYNMAIAALQEVPGCTGCRWRGVRPQRCSCCRRNTNMKDNYEV